MAKKKITKQAAKPMKPEEYIRKKARLLPVYKCYKSINQLEDREMSIIVIRQHPHGTFTFAAYMLDRWCLGVKDTIWQFNVDEYELEEFVSSFRENLDTMDEISYTEAHNWVYGALSFAEDAGISPCKDFALTKYILAEDDDNVELIEYEFGREGEYYLVAKNHQEAAKYVPILDKTLGRGNYTVEIGLFREDFDESADFRYPFEPVPDMDYTYGGKDYPKDTTLHFPELADIVMKETEDISDYDIEKVLSLPADDARTDLQNLILCEIGRQWGKTADELDNDDSCNCYTIGNACMFLTAFATVEETLPVVLEIMRENSTMHDFNFGDMSDILLNPVLCILVKGRPRLLQSFLLEPGLDKFSKIIVLELLENICLQCPQSRQEIIEMTIEILQIYKCDLPYRTICDGTVVAFAIGILVGNGATRYLPFIEELYATGQVDESIEGHIEEVRSTINEQPRNHQLPPMGPYAIRDKYRRFLQH